MQTMEQLFESVDVIATPAVGRAAPEIHAACAVVLMYSPAAHAVHVVAPVPVPVFVMWPARQSEHDATFDCAECLPAAHAVHVVAPVPVPVLVIEPASQSVHDATFDAVEYVPASHAVHVVAPALVPVLVIEPGGQAWQASRFDASE